MAEPSNDARSPAAGPRTTSVGDVLKALSSSENGLSGAEAARRLEQYGPNEITEKKKSRFRSFLAYFWGPIPGMIEAAAVVSAAIQHWDDLAIILTLLVTNAAVGFWEENKASNEIDLLKKRLAPRANVLRDGKWTDLPASAVVPGDVARLRLGNIVPADARLLSGDYLSVDQSALTGESLPVEKHQGDLVYSSSMVRQGEMNAVVTATGMSTFFGKTTALVERAQTVSHFQKAVLKIGDYLVTLAALLISVTSVVELFRGVSPLDLLQFGLVLAIAAIPAALPAVLSVSMAVGAEALAKKEAIVSRLVAIEELAGVDVLCADKTGTITKNELSVGEVFSLSPSTPADVVAAAALASREEDRDPIDTAIITRAEESQPTAERPEVLSFAPFDPVSKRTVAVLRSSSGETFQVCKGAPQAVLALVGGGPDLRASVDAQVDLFASKGYRALGVARADAGGSWRYLGLLSLSDPPREDSAAMISAAKSMGIGVKMVTGDHVSIAREIASEVGLGTDIVTAASITGMTEAQAEETTERTDGFAEVFPEDKYRIVELLQTNGHIVCMTGDGVNDAPALKKADAGIAVSGATDAARSAAAVVLTKPGLSVIVDAVRESRNIFQRMTNYAIYRINETFRVLFFVTLSILAFQFYPVTALMIVLLALLNDLPIVTIAYDNVRYSAKPDRWEMRSLLTVSTFLGTIGVASSFILLYVALDVLHLHGGVLQSFVYLNLSVGGHFALFVSRTKGPFWSIRPARPLLLAAALTQLTATLMAVYGVLLPAMGWELAAIVWGYAVATFLVQDLLKTMFYRFVGRSGISFRRRPLVGNA